MIPRRSDGTSRSSCSSGRSPSWRPTSTPRRAAGSASSPSSTAARAGPTGAAARAPTGSRGAAGSRPSPRASTCASHGGSSRSRSCGPRSRTGRLSYSKVRALTRVEEVEREEDLLSLAEHATAAQLERLVRAYRGVVAVERSEPERWVAWSHDDDGSLLLRARLSADEGALVVAALEAAREAAWERVRTRQALPRKRPSRRRTRPASARTLPRKRRRRGGEALADALVLMADTMLAAGPAARTGGDRHQVVVHVDAAVLAGAPGAAGCCELADGTPLAPETARRLACDASIVALTERDGRTLDVGRKTRSIPPSLRRALAARDRGCRFPGCDRARVDAHHIQHWARGGDTSLDNLVHLCRHHHGLVHEGGFTVERRPGGKILFRRPDGRRIAPCPAAPPGRVAAMRTTRDRPRRLRAALHRADGPGLRGRRDAGRSPRPARSPAAEEPVGVSLGPQQDRDRPRHRGGAVGRHERHPHLDAQRARPLRLERGAGLARELDLELQPRRRGRRAAGRAGGGRAAADLQPLRGRGVDGGLRAQPPGLVRAGEERDERPCARRSAIFVVLRLSISEVRGVGVGVGVTVGVAVGEAVAASGRVAVRPARGAPRRTAAGGPPVRALGSARSERLVVLGPDPVAACRCRSRCSRCRR